MTINSDVVLTLRGTENKRSDNKTTRSKMEHVDGDNKWKTKERYLFMKHLTIK